MPSGNGTWKSPGRGRSPASRHDTSAAKNAVRVRSKKESWRLFGRRTDQTMKIPRCRHAIGAGNGDGIAVRRRFHQRDGGGRVADKITRNAQGASRIVIACLTIGESRHFDIRSDHVGCHSGRADRMRNRACQERGKGDYKHEVGEEFHKDKSICVRRAVLEKCARASVRSDRVRSSMQQILEIPKRKRKSDV